jgi:hypothetical protein
MWCLGQIGDAVAMGLGWAPIDDVVDDAGDIFGSLPVSTKSQGAHAINAIAPAVIGARFARRPFAPACIRDRLAFAP